MTIYSKIAAAPVHAIPASPTLILEQTKYAIVEWSQGKPRFLTIDGEWTPHMTDAYVQPTAKNFNWFVHNQNPKRAASEIIISIYDAPMNAVEEAAGYVAVARPKDAGGRVVAGDAFVVCAPYAAQAERSSFKHIFKHMLTDQFLWRAVIGEPRQMDAAITAVDQSVTHQRPSWQGRRAKYDFMPCRVSVATPAPV